MAEEAKQENQKTIVAFAAGLLIGGLLVWVFGGAASPSVNTDENGTATNTEEVAGDQTQDTTDEEAVDDTSTTSDDEETTDEAAPTMQQGDGSASVSNQQAGSTVTLQSATFPSDEGWIGVRDYQNGQLGGLLGVARYSKAQGLIPEEIILQRATQAGNSYAIVFYSESGDRVFSLADDVLIEGVAATFTAQ